jgi:penicillin-binding protein 1A
MVKIDRRSGKRVFEGTPSDDPKAAIIWEAFKPETEPPRATRQDQIAARRNEILELIRAARRPAQQRAASAQRQAEQNPDFVEEQGGIY